MSKEECDKLHAEQAELTAAGVREQFDRGAEWGKANLPPDKLAFVQRFIGIEEQLSFRCGLAKLRVILPVAEEGGEQELDEKGNPIPPKAQAGDPANKAAAKAVPKAKPPVKAAKDGKGVEGAAAASVVAKPKPKAPEKGKAPSDAEAKTTAAKATPKPKPKADDAYRPPAGSTSTGDPFAAQKAAPPKQ